MPRVSCYMSMKCMHSLSVDACAVCFFAEGAGILLSLAHIIAFIWAVLAGDWVTAALFAWWGPGFWFTVYHYLKAIKEKRLIDWNQPCIGRKGAPLFNDFIHRPQWRSHGYALSVLIFYFLSHPTIRMQRSYLYWTQLFKRQAEVLVMFLVLNGGTGVVYACHCHFC